MTVTSLAKAKALLMLSLESFPRAGVLVALPLPRLHRHALYSCHGMLHTVTAEASSVLSVAKQRVLRNLVYRSTAALDRLNASTDLLNTEQVAMSTTRVVMHQIVLPSDTDSLGICFGGQVLGWIDVCAGLAAKTVAKGPCVTASVDAVHFLKPCRVVGHIVCNIPVLA